LINYHGLEAGTLRECTEQHASVLWCSHPDTAEKYSMMTTPVPWWISYPALLPGMAGLGVAMVVVLKRMANSKA
jgi:hypothetical protein